LNSRQSEVPRNNPSRFSPGLQIRTVSDKDPRSIHIKAHIVDGKKIIAARALIDSGAQGTFMNQQFAEKHQFPLLRLKKEITISNIDNSPNKNGPIQHYTQLPTKVNGNISIVQYYISSIGKEDIIFRLPWLKRTNPEVDWQKKTLKIIPE